MSKKSEGLLANFLDDRWSVTQVVDGATVTASVSAPQSAKSAHVLDALSVMITNETAGSHTVTFAVRDASIAGTALAQWKMLVNTSSMAHINPANMNLYAGKGNGLFFTSDTVLAGVSSSVNATGWTDTSSDY